MGESASSSQPISTADYDVFVSFRGDDVRNNFVSHLQAALKRWGITVFFDEELNRGEEISPALLKAIEQSSISIVIFSKNYASSRWCLSELWKILQYKNIYQQIVMPIFYHVDPSHVRKQTGSYAEAFTKHEKTLRNRNDEIQRWKDALTQVANLSGWDLDNRRPESEMIDKITQETLKKVNRSTLNCDLVGIEHRVERIESCLRVDSNDVWILGIWGMGGIGKTTIARCLFDKIKDQFDGCCFLENVREESGKYGQRLPDLRKKLASKVMGGKEFQMDISCTLLKKMLCGKKVLIILDDIDHMEQLENLAGNRDWFGVGSRIVITTRNKRLLCKADEVYDYATQQLTNKEASLLFSRHAFDATHPPQVFLELSKRAINYASGIPLALKLLGSYLCPEKDIKTWESALARLERLSDDDIVGRILELSFNGLNPEEKNILLDVACFFKGVDLEVATSTWGACGFDSPIALSVLSAKCLISPTDNSQLWMHDLIQETCKAIVRKESMEPGKRSRLFDPEDIFHVFTKNTGTSKIQCIILNMSEINEELELREDAFAKMEKLRLLKFFSDHSNEGMKIRLPRGLKTFPASLTFLFWDDYPCKFLASKFDAQNLVGLYLRQSCIKQLWKENWMFKRSRISLKNLDRLDLSNCSDFSNFSAICDNMNPLSALSLVGTGISNLPSSIENLIRLVLLDLSDCKKLVSLPDSICNLKRLEGLNLTGCKSLQHIPENIGNLESLWRLFAERTSIKHVPSSIKCLKNILYLSFGGCRGIKPSTSDYLSWLTPRSSNYTTSCMGLQLPPLGDIQQLKHLDLSNCNLVEAPSGLHNLSSLHEIDLSGNNFERLPETIFYNLCSLEHLNLSYCRRLRSLPVLLPPSLRYLQAYECTSLESNMSSLILYRGIGDRNETAFINFGNCLKLKNQCNNMLESMVKEVHLAERIVQDLHDQVLSLSFSYLHPRTDYIYS